MKIRQTDFMQTGVAEVTLGDKEYLLPLFTGNILNELNGFLKESTLGSKGLAIKNVKSIYEFFDPKDKGRKFKLTPNSMEALRTGILRKRSTRSTALMCKVNKDDFPSYYF